MKQLFVIGDSISVHYGDYLMSELSGSFSCIPREGIQEALENINLPVGGNGGDSARVLDFLQKQEKAGELNYHILLFNCGLHDIKRNPPSMELQIPPDVYAKNLREILALVKKHGVQPVFINTTPVNDEIHHSYLKENFGIERFSADVINYNRIAEEIMEQEDVPVIDLYAFTLKLGKEAYCDHVHYKESVRKQQAVFIAEKICPMA